MVLTDGNPWPPTNTLVAPTHDTRGRKLDKPIIAEMKQRGIKKEYEASNDDVTKTRNREKSKECYKRKFYKDQVEKLTIVLCLLTVKPTYG